MKKTFLALTIASITSFGTWANDKQLAVSEHGFSFGEGQRVQLIHTTGENRAFAGTPEGQSDVRIHKDLRNLGASQGEAVLKIDDNVYKIFGYGLTSPVVFVGETGLVVMDPGESTEHGAETEKVFRDVTGIDLPVTGIIYSHNHFDHLAGVKGWVTPEDVAAGKVEIYAHSTLTAAVANWASNVGTILGHRTTYTAATYAGTGAGVHGSVTDGLGPQVQLGEVGFIPPTVEFDDVIKVSNGGLDFELHYVPSETDDEIVMWLPDQKILHAAEVLQGENFPNLHTIRGTKARDAEVWYKGIDYMRNTFHDVEIMLVAHGRPVEGNWEVMDVLTAYRDGIQFVHDQSVRAINDGLTPFEMIEVVKLPEHLETHPWLLQRYGTVSHAVQQQFSNYIGFFHGDPWQLEPMAHAQRAEEYVRMMGGRDNIVNAARSYIKNGDFTYAAEILTYPIRVDNDDTEARELKAQAYTEWGYKQSNINWRNWAMTAAGELRGDLDYHQKIDFTSTDVLKNLPTEMVMDMMTVKLKAEDTIGVNYVVNIHFTDIEQAYSFEIRNGIVEVQHFSKPEPKLEIKMTRSLLEDLLAGGGDAAMAKAAKAGEFGLTTGTAEDMANFIAKFEEPKDGSEIPMIVR
ncbi:alkyl sulfatase dimerization domain-containing protein [Photobacterium satsumensis]|uniref:alkyl sulfatase dimerization domain-containing protein n=1 Tax=Photobacterium satsumensis TaxID=2910239 RepID=UPI003D14924E